MNKDIPRGFQINIEKGFDAILRSAPHATLLGLMNRLDKQLETILSGQMADTVKLVANTGPPVPRTAQPEPSQPVVQTAVDSNPQIKVETPRYTIEQRADALKRRQAEIRQLEARLGKLPLFSQSSDGVTFRVPFDFPKRATWPQPLQDIKVVSLIVPEQYPLQPCRVQLSDHSPEASQLEVAFESRAKANPETTLMAHMNYLSLHVKDMAVAPSPTQDPGLSSVPGPAEIATDHVQQSTIGARHVQPSEDDRSHIQHIPRPPEWSHVPGDDEDEDDSSDSGEFSYDTGDETEDEPDVEENRATSAPAERGILLSFPHLELHSIELLELVSLHITVKCERCKDTIDIERLRNNVSGEASGMREVGCKKCANSLAVGYRMDLMHVTSVRAGYLDMDGCTVVDMLPR